jgi:hypothetical protein
MKIEGIGSSSGSISQRDGSADPDPGTEESYSLIYENSTIYNSCTATSLFLLVHVHICAKICTLKIPHCKKRVGDFVLSLKGFVATSITESILPLKGHTNEMDFSMFRYKSVRQPVHICCSFFNFGFDFCGYIHNRRKQSPRYQRSGESTTSNIIDTRNYRAIVF